MLTLAVVFVVAAVFTWIAPMVSLTSFIVACPFASINDVLGWDPRVPWAAALALYGAKEWWRTGKSLIPAKVGLYWSAFLACSALGLFLFTSAIPSFDLYSAWTTLMYVAVGGLIFYSLLQLSASDRYLRAIASAFTLSTLLVGASTFLEGIQSYRGAENAARVAGPLKNANSTAAFLAVAATVMVIMVRARLVHRWFGVLTLIVAALGCLTTLSRMGAVALVVGCALASSVRAGQKLLSRRVLVILAFSSLLAVVFTIGYLLHYRENISGVDASSRGAQMLQAEQALDDLSRWEGVRYSVELWLQHPVFGVGFSVFPFYNYKANGIYLGTHNTFTQVLVGTGTLGAVLLLLAFRQLLIPMTLEKRRLIAPTILVLGICFLFGEMLQAMELFAALAVLYRCICNTDADLVQGLWHAGGVS